MTRALDIEKHDTSMQEVLDALSGLPREQLADAASWFSKDLANESDERIASGDELAQIFPYSNFSVDEIFTASFISKSDKHSLNQLLSDTAGHWGRLVGSRVAIRLDDKSAPGTGRLLLIEMPGLNTFLDRLFSPQRADNRRKTHSDTGCMRAEFERSCSD